MVQLLRLGLRLMAFALGAGLLIAGANIATAGPVAAQARRAADEARIEVLRAEAYGRIWSREDGTLEALGVAMPDNVSLVSWGCAEETKLGAPVADFQGLVIELSVGGYGGAMGLMIGVDAEGAVSGMRVISHGETPGLGAKATEASFEDRLIGLTGPSIPVRKPGTAGAGVEAISGATITTRAVTSGIEQALDLYAQLHKAMSAEGMLP